MIISNQTGIAALKTHFVQCKCSNQRVEGGGANSKVSTFRVQKKITSRADQVSLLHGFQRLQSRSRRQSVAYVVGSFFTPQETNKPTMPLTSDANDFVNANAIQEKNLSSQGEKKVFVSCLRGSSQLNTNSHGKPEHICETKILLKVVFPVRSSWLWFAQSQ